MQHTFGKGAREVQGRVRKPEKDLPDGRGRHVRMKECAQAVGTAFPQGRRPGISYKLVP